MNVIKCSLNQIQSRQIKILNIENLKNRYRENTLFIV